MATRLVKITLCLCFQAGSVEKPCFLLLNSKQSYAIKRDSCTHFYSFRKLTVQGKGPTLESRADDLHSPLVLSSVYFLLICYDVCCHVQLNLFDYGSKMNSFLFGGFH